VAWLEEAISRLYEGPPNVRAVGVGARALAGEFHRTIDFDGSLHQQMQPGAVQRLLDANATVIFNRVERSHPSLYELVRSIRATRLAEVGINAYLAGQGAESFGWHYDTHELAILQLAGRKRWHIARDFGADGQPSDSLGGTELEPGDLARIRRGVWHRTEVLDDQPSLHVAIAMFPLTFARVSEVAGRHLSQADGDQDLFRMSTRKREEYLSELLERLDGLARANPLISENAEEQDVDALTGNITV